MLVQPVDAIDIGKDLYVDVTEQSRATGEVIAIRVNDGESYRRRTGASFSCTPDDLALWAASTVPIFAMVHDPESPGPRAISWNTCPCCTIAEVNSFHEPTPSCRASSASVARSVRKAPAGAKNAPGVGGD